ncbi:unnamed protein product, partial [marine sediment metagenome]
MPHPLQHTAGERGGLAAAAAGVFHNYDECESGAIRRGEAGHPGVILLAAAGLRGAGFGG